jgi:hypothetical protein
MWFFNYCCLLLNSILDTALTLTAPSTLTKYWIRGCDGCRDISRMLSSSEVGCYNIVRSATTRQGKAVSTGSMAVGVWEYIASEEVRNAFVLRGNVFNGTGWALIRQRTSRGDEKRWRMENRSSTYWNDTQPEQLPFQFNVEKRSVCGECKYCSVHLDWTAPTVSYQNVSILSIQSTCISPDHMAADRCM